ncbi:hypothetical protein QZH41_008171 [Actinostola sp. cb2023]|nr:hypothetical protein QZH41_008171 [Actinostola sp. cb2023]
MSPFHGLDRGFGKNITWMTLSEGLRSAKDSKKPAMVIIHKTWCGACKALKPHIANSTEIHEMSKKFVMINLEDDEEPKDSKFDVDGQYFPRVFFVDPSGDVVKDIHNTKLQYLKFKYAYGDAETVLEAMQKVLKKYDTPSEQETKQQNKQESNSKSDEKSKEKDMVIYGRPRKCIMQLYMVYLPTGLGKDIDWVSLDEGYIAARKSWKPMMLVIHKSWCTACQAFSPKFAESKEIKELSKHFIMVNAQDDFDHTDSRFDIEGAYIPRTLFINPLGDVMKDITNIGTPYPENKYYHYDAASGYKNKV